MNENTIFGPLTDINIIYGCLTLPAQPHVFRLAIYGLRKRLKKTQKEFAVEYLIDIKRLRELESGSDPTAMEAMYLYIIARKHKTFINVKDEFIKLAQKLNSSTEENAIE
jgi:hypothetical protein